MQPHETHLQRACAPSVNKTSVSNCFHPLAVASNCGEGVSCQNNRGLCFRFSTPHPQRLRNKIKTFCAWERGAERRQTKAFFFFPKLMAVLLPAQYVTAAL